MSLANRRAFIAGWSLLALAGCGGGGGGAPSPSPGPTPPPPPPPPAPGLSFVNASVHDPSVIRTGGLAYVFGSHLAAARTADLMNWTKLADGVNDANPLFDAVTTDLADTFAWSQVTDLWAPDVALLADGKFHMFYCSCKGDSPRSALGVAVADAVEGPYVNQQIVLKSGMWGLPSEDGTIYDGTKHPNVVDPQVFQDAGGTWWMVYGSYAGGIFILEIDGATGLPLAGQGYGTHLMGGNNARIEGANILYSPESGYYYLLCTFGGLDAAGGYNIRMARSLAADGPYLDGEGNDMANVKSDVSLPLFDDASIAPFGMKLAGNHQFALASGDIGTALGYVSPGGTTAFYDAGTQQHMLMFHTRFPGTGEAHEIRVHEMHLNADDWLVVAPLRYAPLILASPPQTADVSAAQAAGSYKLVNHGKDISAVIKPSSLVTLAADGSVSGGISGSWTHDGSNRLTLTVAGVAYAGVLSRQWNTNANGFGVCFSAISAAGVALWALRTGA